MTADDSLYEGDRYAETDKEEANSEFAEGQKIDYDSAYDNMRDDNSLTMIENVKELIEKLSKLMYYKSNKEGLAKDIIQNTLETLNLKIKDVVNISSTFQVVSLINSGQKEEK